MASRLWEFVGNTKFSTHTLSCTNSSEEHGTLTYITAPARTHTPTYPNIFRSHSNVKVGRKINTELRESLSLRARVCQTKAPCACPCENAASSSMPVVHSQTRLLGQRALMTFHPSPMRPTNPINNRVYVHSKPNIR